MHRGVLLKILLFLFSDVQDETGECLPYCPWKLLQKGDTSDHRMMQRKPAAWFNEARIYERITVYILPLRSELLVLKELSWFVYADVANDIPCVC
jgi:hypothetical protein